MPQLVESPEAVGISAELMHTNHLPRARLPYTIAGMPTLVYQAIED